MFFAALLLAVLAPTQDRTPVDLVPSPTNLAGHVLHRETGTPIPHFRFTLTQSTGKYVVAECETDALGNFAIPPGIGPGDFRVRSAENLLPESGKPSGGLLRLSWDGTKDLDFTILEGRRFEFELDTSVEGAPATMPSGLMVGIGTPSIAEVQDSYPRQKYLFTDVRKPVQIGGPYWVRFPSTLASDAKFANAISDSFQDVTQLTVLSEDGEWLATCALPKSAKPARLSFERRSVFQTVVRELDTSLGQATTPFSMVWFNLTSQEGSAPKDAVGFSASVGGVTECKWLKPGDWKLHVNSSYFPKQALGFTLRPGVNVVPDVLLGERTSVGDIRVVVRDFDGDIMADADGLDQAKRDKDPLRRPELLPEVMLRGSDPFYYEDAPSFATCGVGIRFWCTLEGATGEQYREATFTGLLDGEYVATLRVDRRHVEPERLLLRPGEEGVFTLHKVDPNQGYWIRVTKNGVPVRYSARATLTAPPQGWSVTRELFTNGPLIYVGPNWIGTESSDWAVTSFDSKQVYCARDQFLAEGGRFIATVDLEQGWACRYQLVNEQSEPLTGVSVKWEDRTYVSDDKGQVVLESDEPRPKGLITFSGLEPADGSKPEVRASPLRGVTKLILKPMGS